MNTPPLILIVDDEKDFRDILSTTLRAKGFSVDEAQDGKGALVKLKDIHPDLILLDFKMPDMDGVETFFKIKSEFPDLRPKVAFLTNYGEARETPSFDQKFAQEVGAMDYLKKTEDLEVIAEKVQQLLR